MRSLAALWPCSLESKLSLHYPLAADPALRPGALASSSKNNILRTKKPGCAESQVSLTRMSMNESMNLKHKSTAACNLVFQWSECGTVFWLWLWQWFQRNRYQLAHCAKASFQAQGRKMRTLTEGHWQNQSVFIVFVLINLFMFFSLSVKSVKSAVFSHRITS